MTGESLPAVVVIYADLDDRYGPATGPYPTLDAAVDRVRELAADGVQAQAMHLLPPDAGPVDMRPHL